MAVRTVARERLLWGHLLEELKARLGALAYVRTDRRDLRLDFLRGLAAAAMVVDHVGGDTFLTQLSGGNKYIVSAAEGFVFLSGLVVGMVYGERIVRGGLAEASRGLLRRALTLYKASAGMALTFLALFFMTDIKLWGADRASGLLITDPLEAVAGLFSLHFSFHGSDVLVMYTLMLVVAPAIVYLLYSGRTALVLLASVALWAVNQRYPGVATFPWPIVGSSFPLGAWQLLFVLGMVVGYHRERVTGWLVEGGNLGHMAVVGAASTSYILAWSYARYAESPLPFGWFGDATFGALFAKSELGPARVVTFLGIMVVAYALVHALWRPISMGFGWFLIPLGQSSLYVYIVHIFLVVGVYNVVAALLPVVYWHFLVPPDVINTVSQLFVLAAVWAMVKSRFIFAIVPR